MKFLALLIGTAVCSKLRSSVEISESFASSTSLERSYAEFLAQHGVARTSDTVARSERLAAFAQSVAKVSAQNRKTQRSWTAGLNRFADHTPEEFRSRLGFKRTGTYFIDQGSCGSCWAVAATGALEMRAEIAHKKAPSMLSYKELLDCVENPQHCGGDGGCAGATGELAFQYVAQHGLSARTSYQGDVESTGSCQTGMRSAVVKASSFVRLPVNELNPLMMAIQEGPVVVSVDGEPWSTYESGVFDGCRRDATVNHAVLLVGYGHDSSVQKDYWLVRNSWGEWWGEKGFIRVQRHSSDKGEEGYCGTDYDPKQGVGCQGGPATLPVCGMCGILSDSIYPEGVSSM